MNLNIDGDGFYCHMKEGTIDHLFKQCSLVNTVWMNIQVNGPYSNKSNLSFCWLD